VAVNVLDCGFEAFAHRVEAVVIGNLAHCSVDIIVYHCILKRVRRFSRTCMLIGDSPSHYLRVCRLRLRKFTPM
jgi:hypothetical protein